MEGYPFIILPFVIITMGMSAFIAGEVKVGAQVYGIAFFRCYGEFCFWSFIDEKQRF